MGENEESIVDYIQQDLRTLKKMIRQKEVIEVTGQSFDGMFGGKSCIGNDGKIITSHPTFLTKKRENIHIIKNLNKPHIHVTFIFVIFRKANLLNKSGENGALATKNVMRKGKEPVPGNVWR